MPERKPASRGRDAQVAALQEKGFTFRQARRAVNAVWDVIKAALQRDEEVETPLGTFRPVLVLRAAKLVQRFGKRQMRKQTFRITVKLVPPGSKRWSRP